MESRRDTHPGASASDHSGIDLVLCILRESEDPVVIDVVGSCRDVAVAGNKAPELFARKCAGIYINAGTGSPDPNRSAKLEYNVSLAPLSYAAIFDLPCPVYWMPCFEELGTTDRRPVREYGTHHSFRQGEILPDLAPRMRSFFLYMLDHELDRGWLESLLSSPDLRALEKFSARERHMWCTGGFLHAADKTVNARGEIVAASGRNGGGIWTFDPIEVSCPDDGITRWRPKVDARDRFIFHVRDTHSPEESTAFRLRHSPRVKSGAATGALPRRTDSMLSETMLLHAAAS